MGNRQERNKKERYIKEERIKEVATGHIPIPKSIYNKVGKKICKILYKNNFNKNVKGTGFFMILKDGLKYMITNYHVISENIKNIIINIDLEDKLNIKFDLNNRNLFYYDDLDITTIEIKDSDELSKYIDFLQYDLNYQAGYEQYLDTDIFIIQYQKEEIEIASGKIIEIINNYEFKHDVHTEAGISGSPIILPNTLKVIGIHKEGHKYLPINYGSFIGEIFNKNFIVGEFDLCENEARLDTRIINSYEEYCRMNSLYIEEDNKNEKEIEECIIEIDDRIIPFSYYHQFRKSGKYKIKYTFKNLLTNCNFMFHKCRLKNLDLSNFNTKNVTNMRSMFHGCVILENLNLLNFNTKNVKNMHSMFESCSHLTYLNLSSFNTQKVTDMSYMFFYCPSLKK